MSPKNSDKTATGDLFRSQLSSLLNMRHPLIQLADLIDWPRLDVAFANIFEEGGRPPLPTRLMLGLMILKYKEGLSDEQLTARWLENPYYQYFTGETYFQHETPFDRSSMSRWRSRLGEERLEELLKESLSVAMKSGALKPKDVLRVSVDTTVQPKNIT